MIDLIFYAEQHKDEWLAVTFFDGARWEKGPFGTFEEAERSCREFVTKISREVSALKAKHLETLKNN